jgi:hypothetical protein
MLASSVLLTLVTLKPKLSQLSTTGRKSEFGGIVVNRGNDILQPQIDHLIKETGVALIAPARRLLATYSVVRRRSWS